MTVPVFNNPQSVSTGTFAATYVPMSYTVPVSGSNKRLVVFISIEDRDGVPSNVTFGADVLTLIGSVASDLQKIYCYSKVNPTAQTADITITCPVAGPQTRMHVSVAYLTDAKQEETVTSLQGDMVLPMSMTVTTTGTDNLLVGVFMHEDANNASYDWLLGTGFTSLAAVRADSITSLVEYKTAATAGSYAVDASLDPTIESNISAPRALAWAFEPVPAGGTNYDLTTVDSYSVTVSEVSDLDVMPGGNNYDLGTVDSVSVTVSSVDDLTVTVGGTNVQLDNVDSVSVTTSSEDAVSTTRALTTTDSYSLTTSSSPEMGTVRDLATTDSYSLTVSEESNLTSVSPIILENVDSVSTTVSDEPGLSTNRTLVDTPSISASISSVDVLSVSFAIETTDSYSLTVSEESDFGGSISLVSIDSVSETYSSVDSPTVSLGLASTDSVSFTYSSSDQTTINATLVSVDSYSLTVSERSSIPPREYSKAFLQYYKWMTGHAPFYPR